MYQVYHSLPPGNQTQDYPIKYLNVDIDDGLLGPGMHCVQLYSEAKFQFYKKGDVIYIPDNPIVIPNLNLDKFGGKLYNVNIDMSSADKFWTAIIDNITIINQDVIGSKHTSDNNNWTFDFDSIEELFNQITTYQTSVISDHSTPLLSELNNNPIISLNDIFGLGLEYTFFDIDLSGQIFDGTVSDSDLNTQKTEYIQMVIGTQCEWMSDMRDKIYLVTTKISETTTEELYNTTSNIGRQKRSYLSKMYGGIGGSYNSSVAFDYTFKFVKDFSVGEYTLIDYNQMKLYIIPNENIFIGEYISLYSKKITLTKVKPLYMGYIELSEISRRHRDNYLLVHLKESPGFDLTNTYINGIPGYFYVIGSEHDDKLYFRLKLTSWSRRLNQEYNIGIVNRTNKKNLYDELYFEGPITESELTDIKETLISKNGTQLESFQIIQPNTNWAIDQQLTKCFVVLRDLNTTDCVYDIISHKWFVPNKNFKKDTLVMFNQMYFTQIYSGFYMNKPETDIYFHDVLTFFSGSGIQLTCPHKKGDVIDIESGLYLLKCKFNIKKNTIIVEENYNQYFDMLPINYYLDLEDQLGITLNNFKPVDNHIYIDQHQYFISTIDISIGVVVEIQSGMIQIKYRSLKNIRVGDSIYYGSPYFTIIFD